MASPQFRMTAGAPGRYHPTMNQQTPALKDSPKQAKKFYIRPGTKNKHNMLLMEKVDALAVMVGNFAASQKIMAVTLDGAMTALVATQEQLKELQRANLVKMMQCNRSLRIDGHETNRTPLGIAVPDHLDVHAVPFLEDTIQLENVNSKNVEIPAPDSSNLSARVMLLEGEKDAFGRIAEDVDNDLHMRYSHLSIIGPAQSKPHLRCIEEGTDPLFVRGKDIKVRLPGTLGGITNVEQPPVVYRTVQIDNLPSSAPMDILMPLIDTGRMLSVAVEYGLTTEMTVSFLHEAAARAFVERRKEDPIIFGTQVAQVYITEPPTGAITGGQEQLLKAGVTRCLLFSNMLENLTKVEFDKIIARIEKAPNEEIVLYSKKDFQKAEVRMGFNSLEKASLAKSLFDAAIVNQGIRANWKWRGCLVKYIPDEGTEATERYFAQLEDEKFPEPSRVL